MRNLFAAGMVLLLTSGLAFAQQANMGSDAERAAGKIAYDKYCSQCHGDTGNGVGIATPYLKPAPRDFTSGKYKFRSTSSGSVPIDEDIARVIRDGVYGTSMPGFSEILGETEIQNLVYYLKTFSPKFQDPDYAGEVITISSPPAMDEASITRGREVYEEIGCIRCHGETGLGDGNSAPTMLDDWGYHIRPADLTARWTYRGGPTREAIFRAFSTGLNGTPMPSYYDSLSEEDRWHLTNYIYSLGDSDEPNYATYVEVVPIDEDIDLNRIDEQFSSTTTARFPVVGQIMQKGRNFYPSAQFVEVDGIYNRNEIALRVRWHDMVADEQGENGLLLEAPEWGSELPAAAQATTSGGDADGGDDFWGDEGDDGGDDFWDDGGDEAAADDFWGDEAADTDAAAAGAAPTAEFSDAIAIQLPKVMPEGARKPYFLYGDMQNGVDLWFVDLAKKLPEAFTATGSTTITESNEIEFEVTANYDNGEWTAVFKRSLKGNGIEFAPDTFTPMLVSTWDGFNRERGNKRGLTQWKFAYLKPREVPSAMRPMLIGAGIALLLELGLVFWLRRKYAGQPLDNFETQGAQSAAATR